jgi:quinol monooxygenase YgiN
MSADGEALAHDVLLTGRIGLLVRIPCRPGGRAGVLDAIHRYADGLAEEPGTELFSMSIDPDDSDVVWLHEWFRDDDAMHAHRRATGFHRMMQELSELVGGPPGVLRLDPLRMRLSSVTLEADDLGQVL